MNQTKQPAQHEVRYTRERKFRNIAKCSCGRRFQKNNLNHLYQLVAAHMTESRTNNHEKA